MNIYKSMRVFLGSMALVLILISCKSQILQTEAPFEINEKVYHYWSGGKQGTQGTAIRFTGRTKSLNVSFSKLYFQNHEYDIVPQFNSHGFVIEGNYSEFKKRDLVLDKDPVEEYGNQPVSPEKKIPFDLNDDEAVILYSVNGMEGYHKVSGIKQTEKVFMP